MENKIDIPENLQEICRDLAKVAQKHKLYELTGKFRHQTNWGGEISFVWISGRHDEDNNKLSISTSLYVNTKVTIKKEET